MVTFRAERDRFSETPAPDAINDMLGADLAAWLRDGLRAAGFDARPVIAEDYGYGFWLVDQGVHYWVNDTQLEPPDDDHPLPLWLVDISDNAGCLPALRRRPQGDPTRIAYTIHTLLQTDPHIHDIQWWERDVYKGTPRSTPTELFE